LDRWECEKKMKSWLKGGLIGLALGYVGYIIAFFFFYAKIGFGTENVSFIDSIPSFTWFVAYSSIFFGIGALVGWLIRRK
jgi:hypothetical protein